MDANQFSALLWARRKGRELREARVSCNRGGPEDPLSDGELETKFRDDAGRVLGEGRAGELWEAPGSLGRPRA